MSPKPEEASPSEINPFLLEYPDRKNTREDDTGKQLDEKEQILDAIGSTLFNEIFYHFNYPKYKRNAK